ncbi:MAG: PilZ domain-containing protein [Proteobacteria bacterium]|nr:PilZ domain-containing protein [Pseudomonadota bacterium]
MSSSNDHNRRAHKRVLVANSTTVAHDGDRYRARILNISAGGAGIRMDVRLEDQTRIAVDIENIGLVPATVVRQMKDGVGVKFELSVEKEKRFLRQISQIVAEKRGAIAEQAV